MTAPEIEPAAVRSAPVPSIGWAGWRTSAKNEQDARLAASEAAVEIGQEHHLDEQHEHVWRTWGVWLRCWECPAVRKRWQWAYVSREAA